MFYVLKVNNGPDYFQEHCYDEVVEVYHKLCMTSNENTASQLQNAYVFHLIGTFEKEHEAKEFMLQYRLNENVESPKTNIVKEIIPVNQEKSKNWYGNGNVIFQ